jgi:hypothetical protein
MALGLALIGACVAVPPLRSTLGLVVPTLPGLIGVALSVLVTWAVAELVVLRVGARRARSGDTSSPALR